VLVGLIAAISSCGDQLDGGAACPTLCPEQNLPVRDTVLDVVTFDSTVGPFPLRGQEPALLLASRGDTLDVRAVARYDSLPTTYTENGTSHDVTAVDSSRVFIRIDTSVVNYTGTITLKVFDVDTTAADTNTAALIPLFRPDRLLGSLDIPRERLFLDDTVTVQIPNSFVLAKILGHGRIRIGFQLVGHGDITLRSVESNLPAALQYDPAPGNTSVASRSMGPLSNSPTTDPLLENDLRDFSLVVKGLPTPTERVTAGGLPSYRAYMRFDIPKYFLDSVVIVRAQLSIVQRPVRGFQDTLLTLIYPVAASSSETVTDIRRAALLVYPALSFGVKGIAYVPSDSGERLIDMVQLFRQWSTNSANKNAPQTALVLRGASEGRQTGRLAFFGIDAPLGLRPRLRISYVARSRFGIP